MQHLIYYFSGTGNSLAVARMLAKKLDGETEVRAITNDLERRQIILDTFETVGFVFPIYGSDTPWPVKAVAEKMQIPERIYLYAIGTCNERGGHSLDVFNGFLMRRGLHLSYAKLLNMPGNCLESNAEENEERLELADFHTDIFAKNINRRFHGTVENFDSPDNTTEWTKNRYAATPFGEWHVDPQACIGCGICENLCPMKNITLIDGKPEFHLSCAYCFGCFHFCPQQAIYKECAHFGQLDGRTRYHHPDICWQELAEQQKRL